MFVYESRIVGFVLIYICLIPEGANIYTCPSTNSTSSTRMLRASYEKETTESLISERDRLVEDVKLLEDSIKLGNKTFRLKYEIFLTMLDGSAIIKLEACSTHHCFYCGRTKRTWEQAGRKPSFYSVTQLAPHIKFSNTAYPACMHG